MQFYTEAQFSTEEQAVISQHAATDVYSATLQLWVGL
jgi:hypothetical protein